MNLSLIVILACCLGCVAVIPSTAYGAELSFSGAITEPTCPEIANDTAPSPTASQPHLLTCMTPGINIAAPTSYSLSRVSLSGAANDQLLKYFVHYVKTDQPAAASPVLLTRVYL